MRRFLVKLVQVGTILLIVSTAVYYAQIALKVNLGIFPNSSDKSFLSERTIEWALTDTQKFDTFIFGPSTGFHGINPMVLNRFGISAFSFCSPSQGPQNSLEIYQSLIKKKVPKVVVLDCYPGIWHRNIFKEESALDWCVGMHIVNLDDLALLWQFSLQSFDAKPIILLNSIARTALFFLQMDYVVKPISKSEYFEYAGRGHGAIKKARITGLCCDAPLTQNNEKIYAVLKEFKDLCEAKSIDFIVHLPPTHCDFKFNSDDFEDFCVIDGRNWHGHLNPIHFDCGDHLLQVSADEYSAWLAQEVKKLRNNAIQLP